MGEDVAQRVFTRDDRQRYRDKVRRCLDVFERMLRESRFDFESPMTGLEVELSLVDADGDPALRNAEVLDRIDDPAFVSELGRFNLEINVPPRSLREDGLVQYESAIRAQLNTANDRALEAGASMVMIGILPTLTEAHLTHAAISANPRYALLDEQMLLARGEDLHIDIRGVENLETWSDSIAPEAACTSVQFHVQVAPDDFAAHWNAAQCLAGLQVALGANSPYFMGRQLWHETRIALFSQATDTRPAELKSQGVRPRVWFGEQWITNVFDLFEENLRYFPALLPVLDDEDPKAVLDASGTPSLNELRLHNGTVWRWNRPIYDVVDDVPHLRIENRVIPAGPTVIDIMANGAFYYGALRALATADRPIWSRMSFATAEENLTSASIRGIEANVYWPGAGDAPVTEIVLRHLLPLAHEGLRDWGVDDAARERLLGVIEARCMTGRNGATWQIEQVTSLEQRGMSRMDALRAMVHIYQDHMHENIPVHSWPPL